MLQHKLPTHRSWVRLTAISAYCSLIPFGLLMGVLAMFGASTVHFEGEPIIGIAGLLAGVGISMIFATAITVFSASFGYAGLWLFSRFSPLEFECRDPGSHNQLV